MKTFIRYSIFIVLFLVLGFFVTNYFVSKKIKSLLDEEKALTYTELKVNTFSGNLYLEEVKFEESDKKIKIKEIDINVDILHYLFNKEIKIESIDAEDLDLELNLSSKQKDDKEDDEKTEIEIVSIGKINLKNTTVTLERKTKTIFEAFNLNLQAKDISWPIDENFEWLENESIYVEAESLSYDLDDLHNLKSEGFNLKNNFITFSNFEIEPKFSKGNYINHIRKEKDLMNLKTKSLKISDFGLSKKDSLTNISSKKIEIDSSDFNIYRDKSIADDTSIKPLYSKSLRDLEFKLNVDSLLVSEMNVTYQELSGKDEKPGEIKFNSINGSVVNLHNTLNAETPEIKAKLKSRFSKKSNIYFNLSFVPDHETFHLSTLIKNIEDKSINTFFAPAMGMELDGEINEIKTSFVGNNSEMNGDFKIAYEKLKLNILKKDGSKNNFASLISNVFVKNRDVDDSFKLEEVKRDKTKSFWNYVWTFHLEGLKKSLL